MNFSMEMWNHSACHCSVFFRIEKYFGGCAMFVFSFRSRDHKQEDLYAVFEMKINHTGKTLTVFVWNFLILTVIATVRNFVFYVENLT